MDYQFNGNVYHINDIIHFVEYSPSNLFDMTQNHKASYAITLNFEIYIPTKYNHWFRYYTDIPNHVLLHGGLCYQCYTIIHEVFLCDFCQLSLCTECQAARDMSIKQCEECGLYRCVRYSLEAGKCIGHIDPLSSDTSQGCQCKNCGEIPPWPPQKIESNSPLLCLKQI